MQPDWARAGTIEISVVSDAGPAIAGRLSA